MLASSPCVRYKVAVKTTILFLSIGLSAVTTASAQTPAAAQKQAPATAAINFTAKSANVSESGTPIKINILRWSTDAERNAIVASMDPNAPPPGARGGRGGAGGRGRGGLDPNDPALADVDGGAAGGAAAGGRGGRGGAAAGGRGGRGGRGDAAPPPPPNPIARLTTTIGGAQTVGYIWTNEVVGYSIKYAYRIASPDGGERIILATDRRLGAYNNAWKPAGAATPTDYEFTVVEIRLDSKGAGEGKASLTTKVVVDNDAKSIALDNYAATPVVLQGVKR
jgi:hypothetical protein